jgi:ferredoxin--NADP+ reductase
MLQASNRRLLPGPGLRQTLLKVSIYHFKIIMFIEQVTWVHHWSDRTFSFKCTRNTAFRFQAGEFAMIGLMIDGKRVVRAYSVVSPPWSEELEFLSIKIADGELTSRLQHIEVGSEIVVMPKCTGTLVNSALDKGGDLWMLATGTGLAPFMSLIRDLDTLETWRKIHIVHSVRDAKDLAYTEDLKSAFKLHPTDGELHDMVSAVLDYQPIITGQGESRITDQLAMGHLPVDIAEDKIMVCGNLEFNHQVADWCKSKGMPEGSIREPGQFVVERAFVEK